MKTMDDLVFENRNHDYGAYVLRSTYPGNVSKAFAGGLLFAAAIISVPYLMPPKSQIVPPSIIVLPPIQLRGAPIIERPTQPAKKSIATNQNAAPVVTTDPVVETVTDPVETSTNGTDDVVEPTNASGGYSETSFVEPVVDLASTVFTHAEVMPKYEGGLEAMSKFLSKRIRYPSRDKAIGTEGTVFVQFVVNSEGKVVNVEVIRGISSDCDKEAARVVSLMTKWSPGIQNKVPVSVRMVLPIKFKLDN